MLKRFWLLLILMSFLIISDQLSKGAIQSSFYLGESKVIIDNFFNFTYVQNPGAAFGFMAQAESIYRKILFLFLPVIFCGWIFYTFIKSLAGPIHLSLAYSLILAGATGNLIDRFSLGYVVDFLDFYYGSFHFWTFNIADSCITVAAFLLIYDTYYQWQTKKKLKDASSLT